MSCCDNSTVKIVNSSGQTVSVTAVSPSVGSIRNISVGNSAANNGYLAGNAYSAGGTKGAASGSVTIQVGSSTASFKLSYGFTPDNVFGKCPCTSSVSGPASLSNGNYTAEAAVNKGSSDGQASVVWTIASSFGP
jgi:hypothetical protein